ncbi:MAG TPA: CPBP family intramembrane glutamic endopeptidase [Rhabdochlamydiaceae bacterium]|nr:CPBP family intramembrane glutamic endopeptidase [Rhabdochlamydiaceae bacterium]
MKPVLQPTFDAFRIDRNIRAFYENHSRKNAIAMGVRVYELSSCFLVMYYMGMFNGFGGLVLFKFLESLGFRNLLRQFLNYFPAHNAFRYIGFGVASGLIHSFLDSPTNRFITHQLWKMGMPITHNNREVAVWIQSPRIGILMGLITIALPPFEEFFFRGKILDFFIDTQEHPLTRQERISLVTLKTLKGLIVSSLLFGLYHVSPGQRWANLPLFMYTTTCGFSMGLLKITTGNLWAPATAHVLNNAIAYSILQR